ncbi:hypothetical protein OG866_28135 [Streptomyces sp. NBC_00663]|uniref:hypothetical protein n=1 Tax=Streptomyces sp. NBC_00663 TaxID=2975801 RepID=UPI002E3815E2|nr:hypothetical protein [Streptomyces sp. NBC_00663]
MWSVTDETDRLQWGYVPFEHVGPLHYGMSHDEAASAMKAQGFSGADRPMSRSHGALARRTHFRPDDAPQYVTAVTAYYRKSGELACVAVDALCGPQVSIGEVQLIGRAPSTLADQLHDYAESLGLTRTFSVEGDAVSDELGVMARAQRADDILLTRAFFVGPFQDWAYTLHDCVPTDEWDIR